MEASGTVGGGGGERLPSGLFNLTFEDTVRTSQGTHPVSITMTNQLMLFGKQSLFTVRTIRNTQI
jgi:hypothetical protein